MGWIKLTVALILKNEVIFNSVNWYISLIKTIEG